MRTPHPHHSYHCPVCATPVVAKEKYNYQELVDKLYDIVGEAARRGEEGAHQYLLEELIKLGLDLAPQKEGDLQGFSTNEHATGGLIEGRGGIGQHLLRLYK